MNKLRFFNRYFIAPDVPATLDAIDFKSAANPSESVNM